MAQIPQEKIDEVKYASDVVDVVSGYLTLRKKGRNFFGLCPFHKEKTASFSVNPELQIFHCFGCGAGGNVFTFIMRMEGVTFPESVKVLAQAAGIVLPEDEEDFEQYREKEALFYVNNFALDYFLGNMKTDAAIQARDYLEKRGIPESEYSTFGIGYAFNQWDGLLKAAAAKSLKPQILLKAGLVIKKDGGGFYDRFRGRIVFAIKNLSGQVVGFGARRIINDNSPKYINSPETEIYQKRFILYGLYQARDTIRQENEVVIVEGYTDFTSLWRVNIKNVVATSGTALTEDHARMLRRYTTNATLLYDSDSAGAAAALRGADLLLENGLEVKICQLPNGQDPDDYARQQGEEKTRHLLESAVPMLEFKLKRLESQGRFTSTSQKTTATRELIATVAKVTDPIRQAFLVRDLSDRLNLEESTLWSEISKLDRQRKMRAQHNQSDQVEADDQFFASKRGAAELGILETALLVPDLVEKIQQHLNVDDISQNEIRTLLEKLFHDNVDPLTFQPQQYLSSVQNPTIAKRLSQLVNKSPDPAKQWEYARGCLISLRRAVLDAKIAEKKGWMQDKQQDIDTTQIMQEIKTLLDERNQLAQTSFLDT